MMLWPDLSSSMQAESPRDDDVPERPILLILAVTWMMKMKTRTMSL